MTRKKVREGPARVMRTGTHQELVEQVKWILFRDTYSGLDWIQSFYY